MRIRKKYNQCKCTSGRVRFLKHFRIDQISMVSQEFKGSNNEGPATPHNCICILNKEKVEESIINLGESIRYDESNIISYLTGSDDPLNKNAANVESIRKKLQREWNSFDWSPHINSNNKA